MKKILLVGFAIVAAYAHGQYVLLWSDEFEGTSLNLSNWTFDLGGGGWGNNESQYYTSNPGNIKVENGFLNITAKREQIGTYEYTSSRITTKNLFSHRYGKAEARIKLPLGQGLWPAFWMLGANISTVGWPQCGEIDIMEHVSNDPEIHGTIHWNNNGHATFGDGITCSADEFHVYSIEWDQNSIKWFLDGVQYLQANIQNNINNTDEFHKPFYFLLNMAVGGNWPGYPNASTVFPAEMYVDYVRFYMHEYEVGVEENTNLSGVKYGPNPTENQVKINLPDSEGKSLSVRIYSPDGVLVSEEYRIYEHDLSVDVEKLTNGIYFIELIGNQINEKIKILKK